MTQMKIYLFSLLLLLFPLSAGAAPEDDMTAALAALNTTEASIYTTRAAATPLLNNLINTVNALPNSGTRNKVISVLTPFVKQYNLLKAPVDALHSEVPNLLNINSRLLAIAAAAAIVTAPVPADAWTHGSSGGTSPFISPLKIGAGGWNTGVAIANDGTRFTRTDTYGGFKFNAGTGLWEQFVVQSKMPSAAFGYFPATGASEVFQGAGGVYEIDVMPSDSSKVYMIWNAKLFASTDGGATWVLRNMPAISPDPNTGGLLDPNGFYRQNGKRMAVDPNNSLHLIISTYANGVYETTDGGATTPTLISAIPTATDENGNGFQPGYNVAFDPSSAFSGGKTQTAYVFAYVNTGTLTGKMWVTTNGGSTWTATTGGPTTMDHMVVAPTGGTVWATDSINGRGGSGGNLWKYAGGVWTQVTAAGTNCHSVAVDPNSATHIICGTPAGQVITSNDTGVTWNALAYSIAGTDVPWLPITGGIGFMANGDTVFDKNVNGLVLMGMGLGTFTSTPPATSGSNVWTSLNAGQEQLVSVSGNAINGVPVVGNEDRASFYLSSPNTYPSVQNNPYFSVFSLAVSWEIDYAYNNHNFMAQLLTTSAGNAGNNSGFSNDGGQTWQPFASYTINLPASALGGNCGINSNPVIVDTTGVGTTTGLTSYTVNGSGSHGTILRGYNNGLMNQSWRITVIDSTHFQLLGSACSDWTTSGSAVTYHFLVETQPRSNRNGYYEVAGIANNGSGLIRVTPGDGQSDIANAQMYCLSGVGGTVEANGCWVSTNVTSTTFDLAGSTFTNAWTNNTGTITTVFPKGGTMAVSTSSNMIATPANNDHPYCTQDGGATWPQMTLPSEPVPVKFTNAVYSATGNGSITYTTTANPNIPIGQSFTVHGASPSGYNFFAGGLTAVAGTTGTTVVGVLPNSGVMSNPGAFVSAGGIQPKEPGWSFAEYTFRHTFVADHTTANTFYAYNYQTGVYKIVNCTATLVSGTDLAGTSPGTATTNLFPNGAVASTLKDIKGNAGHLFFTPGLITSATHPASSVKLYRSTDGGVTWPSIANVLEVAKLDTGAIAPGSDYPTVYVEGFVSSLAGCGVADYCWGLWRTTATAAQWNSCTGSGLTKVCGQGVVWTKITDYPNGNGDNPAWLIADGVTWNKWYMGFGGSGWAYGQQN